MNAQDIICLGTSLDFHLGQLSLCRHVTPVPEIRGIIDSCSLPWISLHHGLFVLGKFSSIDAANACDI